MRSLIQAVRRGCQPGRTDGLVRCIAAITAVVRCLPEARIAEAPRVAEPKAVCTRLATRGRFPSAGVASRWNRRERSAIRASPSLVFARTGMASTNVSSHYIKLARSKLCAEYQKAAQRAAFLR